MTVAKAATEEYRVSKTAFLIAKRSQEKPEEWLAGCYLPVDKYESN